MKSKNEIRRIEIKKGLKKDVVYNKSKLIPKQIGKDLSNNLKKLSNNKNISIEKKKKPVNNSKIIKKDSKIKLTDSSKKQDKEELPEEPVIIIPRKVFLARKPEIIEEVIEVGPSFIKESPDKKTKAYFLCETILKAFYLSTWKRQNKILKYQVKDYNKKRANFRNFIAVLDEKINNHKLEYLLELFDTMASMPYRPGVVHDPNYGKLKFVNKEVLRQKYSNRIKEWSLNNYDLKIGQLADYLISSISKLREDNLLKKKLAKANKFNNIRKTKLYKSHEISNDMEKESSINDNKFKTEKKTQDKTSFFKYPFKKNSSLGYHRIQESNSETKEDNSCKKNPKLYEIPNFIYGINTNFCGQHGSRNMLDYGNFYNNYVYTNLPNENYNYRTCNSQRIIPGNLDYGFNNFGWFLYPPYNWFNYGDQGYFVNNSENKNIPQYVYKRKYINENYDNINNSCDSKYKMNIKSHKQRYSEVLNNQNKRKHKKMNKEILENIPINYKPGKLIQRSNSFNVPYNSKKLVKKLKYIEKNFKPDFIEVKDSNSIRKRSIETNEEKDPKEFTNNNIVYYVKKIYKNVNLLDGNVENKNNNSNENFYNESCKESKTSRETDNKNNKIKSSEYSNKTYDCDTNNCNKNSN